jgi:hypothetical protein
MWSLNLVAHESAGDSLCTRTYTISSKTASPPTFLSL